MAEIDDIRTESNMAPIMLPSGALFYVHDSEVAYVNDRAKKYMTDNKFQNVSDLQDLDRMLTFECFCYRWSKWISSQMDYWGDSIDSDKLQKALNSTSSELRAIKKSIGVDKETREKQRGEDSVDTYLMNLRARAKEFGIVRNQQLDMALELFNELKAILILHNNCTEEERKEQKVTVPEVFDWIVKEAIPRYDAIDLKFRTDSQKYWIRRQ